MGILKADKTETWNGVKVQQYFLTKHNPNNIDLPEKMTVKTPIAITIHNTTRLSKLSAGATEQAEQHTRATVNGNMNTVRVHFYVDENGAWQNLPLDWQSWHANCGESQNSIAIECIMSSGYTATDKRAELNAIKLIGYLMKKYGMKIDQLRTHTYWLHKYKKNGYGITGSVDQMNISWHSYKNCPAYIIPHWNDFKSKVEKEISSVSVTTTAKATTATTKTTVKATSSSTTVFKEYKVKVVCDVLNVRKTPTWEDSDIVCTIKNNEVYTIVGEKTFDGRKFGKLKSGAGYICIEGRYVKKV